MKEKFLTHSGSLDLISDLMNLTFSFAFYVKLKIIPIISLSNEYLGLVRQKYSDSPAMAAPTLADTSTSLQSLGIPGISVMDILGKSLRRSQENIEGSGGGE